MQQYSREERERDVETLLDTLAALTTVHKCGPKALEALAIEARRAFSVACRLIVEAELALEAWDALRDAMRGVEDAGDVAY